MVDTWPGMLRVRRQIAIRPASTWKGVGTLMGTLVTLILDVKSYKIPSYIQLCVPVNRLHTAQFDQDDLPNKWSTGAKSAI